ncbi:hypothetical protein NPIL_328091 [Nephila pilipes]|uniref:Uncharacterized protein n=1 Tax=Nephila pilipes TaxID=299642 RepID=A0A8X6T406_NEPPI|nr:hypothetical protein NPIL_328091 [Nephila pilipes]
MEGSARPGSITLMEHPCPGDDQEQEIEQKRLASLHSKTRAAGSLETRTVRCPFNPPKGPKEPLQKDQRIVNSFEHISRPFSTERKASRDLPLFFVLGADFF